MSLAENDIIKMAVQIETLKKPKLFLIPSTIVPASIITISPRRDITIAGFQGHEPPRASAWRMFSHHSRSHHQAIISFPTELIIRNL